MELGIIIGLYVITCILWGIFATRMQKFSSHGHSCFDRLFLVLLINTLITPISIIFAIIRFEKIVKKIKNPAK